jgi:RNA polymerase sigma factor (sigma-70 family)
MKARSERSMVYNPFYEKQVGINHDQELIDRALEGGSAELESLVLRHQSWIYNIALGMTCDASDAEDITQEILIKMITSLATYDRTRAAFRTWLYRIVANHVISKRRCRKEEAFSSLMSGDAYHEYVESIADEKAGRSPEHTALVREARNTCVAGMLLCLDKRQRFVFILGAVFGVDDAVGSEILEISRENFRKILSRSRKKLSHFFANTCSLVNENNPCTCARWIEPMKKLSLIRQEQDGDPAAVKSIAEVVRGRAREYCDLYDREMVGLYRDLPFSEPPDMMSWIRNAIKSDQFKGLMDLN